MRHEEISSKADVSSTGRRPQNKGKKAQMMELGVQKQVTE